jgi:hypothetical protein
LLACISEERVECLSDDFVEKRLFRLVTLVVGHMDPVRDRVEVRVSVGCMRASRMSRALASRCNRWFSDDWCGLRFTRGKRERDISNLTRLVIGQIPTNSSRRHLPQAAHFSIHTPCDSRTPMNCVVRPGICRRHGSLAQTLRRSGRCRRAPFFTTIDTG